MAGRLMAVVLVSFSFWHGAAMAQTVGIASTQNPAFPPRDQQPPAAGTSSISGRVTDETTGMPLRRATVRLNGAGMREAFQATTDAAGRYSFRDLPAGMFNVFVNRSGYVARSYGQRRSQEPGKPITLTPRQAVENIDVALARGAIMTGRVVDEYGEPVADVQVTIARVINRNGRRQQANTSTRQTDDIGEFRVAGLSGGDYQISASIRTFPNGAVTADRNGYAPTYYPGTPNAAEAQLIRVGEGQLISGLAIALVPTRLAQISGIAIDADGQPITRGSVSLSQRPVAFGPMFTSAQIRADGTFTLPGVPPGDYMLMAGNGPENRAASIAELSVNGADISNVVLAPPRPVSISGRVIVDAAATTTPRTDNLRITAVSLEPTLGFRGPVNSEPLRDATTFTLSSPTGRVRLMAQGLPGGWAISRATAGGVDVTDELVVAADVPDVTIEITNRVPGLTGAVSNTRGELVPDAIVLIFPQDTQGWGTLAPGRGAMLRADDKGEFRLRMMRPGSYFVAAVTSVSVEVDNWTDAAYLETLVSRATRVTLEGGDQRRVDLRLDDR